MRFILRIIVAPIALGFSILTAFLLFVVSMSAAILSLVSGLVFLGALVLLFTKELLGGGLFLFIAFLISPAGLPALAEWLVLMLNDLSSAMREFVFD